MSKKLSAEEAIKICFRDMVNTVPFEKITVSDLCRNAGVSRKTFYAYFENKQYLLEQIFHDDIAIPISNLMALFPSQRNETVELLLIKVIYQEMYKHKNFYTRAITQNRARIFIHVFQQGLMELSIDLFRSNNGDCSNYFMYTIRFICAGHAAIAVQWIRDGMITPPEELAEWIVGWSKLGNIAMRDPES